MADEPCPHTNQSERRQPMVNPYGASVLVTITCDDCNEVLEEWYE